MPAEEYAKKSQITRRQAGFLFWSEMSGKTAVLFANGEFVINEKIMEIIHQADFKVAVDGGYIHMKSLDLTPNVIIGDLDSIEENGINELEDIGIKIIRFDVHKDETDLELVVEYLLDLDFEHINILGATGGRTDHFVGNLLLFSNPKYQKNKIKIWTDKEEIYYCKNYQEIIGKKGDLVSLIPISDQVTAISTEGLDYPLIVESLFRWKSRGISNQMSTRKAKVRFDTGTLLCVHEYSTEIESR